MDFKQSLVYAAKHDPAQHAEVITLNEYIDRVSERPTIAATAHERIYDMIRAAGFSDGRHAGEVSHGFFREELFGLDVPLDRLVRTFEPPPRVIKRVAESCCCGGHPGARRAPWRRCSSVASRTGLGPTMAPSTRVGIGTFEPGDPKSMSMEQLTGGLDFRAIETHGSDAHPLALDWAGEFSKSNRGLFEAVEFFKNPAEFRNLFLTMAQEKQFKVAKFGYIDSDTVILAHTNEAEFRAFMGDAKNEALKDRLVTVAVPYNVRVSDEEKIYRKLLTSYGRVTSCTSPRTRCVPPRWWRCCLASRLTRTSGWSRR